MANSKKDTESASVAAETTVATRPEQAAGAAGTASATNATKRTEAPQSPKHGTWLLTAKEFKLVFHPMCVFMLACSLLVMVPNWPYALIFLYIFICPFVNALNAREQHDMDFSIVLPVSRNNIVAARIGSIVLLELASVVLMFAASLLRPILGDAEFFIGMPPNLAFMGMALLAYAAFNLVFYLNYWKNPARPGLPTVLAMIPGLAIALGAEAAPYASPRFAALFAQPGFGCLEAQAALFTVCAVVFAVATAATLKASKRIFRAVDC